jgi:glutamyl-tRNA synthetase
MSQETLDALPPDAGAGDSVARAPCGRLAPSPTGVLHLGNARTFLLAWLSSRSRGGRVLLRVEDIDGPRVRVGATEQALADLRWMGLDWDGPVTIQSQRLELYRDAADRLMTAGLAYPCVCSRKEVEDAASAPHERTVDTGARDPRAGSTPAPLATAPDREGPVYPGTCRGRFASLGEAERASGRPAALRFRVECAAVPFNDLFRGPEPGAVRGDFVIQKRDGGPAYQLAVVVDDAAQGVTEVLRADDLLPSTPRQLLLYAALGLTPPRFAHTPLVVGRDGLRLAKRHGDTSLAHFRRHGVAPETLVGYLANLSGLAPRGAHLTPRDLLATFDLSRIPRTPAWGDDHALLDRG